MDPREHDRLLEALEKLTASLRVTPQIPQRLRARGVGRLVVAYTDVLYGLQLTKSHRQGSWRCRRSGISPDRDPFRQRTLSLPAVAGSARGGKRLFQ